jgi:hypothetical protein
MQLKESQFSKKVKKVLDTWDRCYYFIKEAKSLRGIPDVVGCCNGHFFALELKKSASEARKKTGRIVLQLYIVSLIRKAGGFAEIVHPENLDETLNRLWTECYHVPRSHK